MSESFTETELKRAKDHTRKAYMMSLDDNSLKMELIGKDALHYGNADLYAFPREIENVSISDVEFVMNEVLSKLLGVGLVGRVDEKKLKNIRDLMEGK